MELAALLCDTGKSILGEACGQMLGCFFRARRLHKRFEPDRRNAMLSVGASRSGLQFQNKNIVSNGFPIEGRFSRVNPQDLKGGSAQFRGSLTFTTKFIDPQFMGPRSEDIGNGRRSDKGKLARFILLVTRDRYSPLTSTTALVINHPRGSRDLQRA